jgi:folate-binding protein YgfZ
MTSADDYHQIKQKAAIGSLSPRGQIAVTGGDRAAYLHGLLTNDIAALQAGGGCYSAWLTPQGRMLTDLHVFAADDMILLDVPADLVQPTLRRLDQFLFSEDVQLSDLSAELRGVWLHGPASAAILDSILVDSGGIASWVEYENRRASFGSSRVLVARVSQLGVSGYCVYVTPDRAEEFISSAHRAGAREVSQSAIDAVRIEYGYPIFGRDMTDDTIPLEAEIEDRAISFTKGCYVGQEVIVRVLHRGHGRVARRLVGLQIIGGVPVHGAKLLSDSREIGFVTSTADSPVRGPIALGYIHRDFALPGTAVEVEGPTRLSAIVTSRPMPPALG